MNRRSFNQLLGATGLALTTTSFLTKSATAGKDDPVYVTWGGYDDESFHKLYKDKHGTTPEFAFSGDEEEMFQKVRAGFKADLGHPTTSTTARWLESGFSQPIDVSRLTEWDNLFPALKKQPGVTQADGKVISVPFDWGRTSVIYRTDKIKLDEESYGVLWDEKYKGRIAVIGGANDLFPVAAMYGGFNPYSLTAEERAKTLELIRQQKPLVRFYADDMTSIVQGIASGEIWAALAWDETAVKLSAAGIPVKFMQPKEGVLTWLGGITLLRGNHTDRAYDVLNSMLDPIAGEKMISSLGYGHSNKRTYEKISAEILSSLQVPRDPSAYLDSGTFMQALDGKDEISKTIAEIKALP